MSKKIWAVIPARYASTRLPAKPLADLCGKPLIQRVYENSRDFGIFDKVIVATDDERIYSCVRDFGGDVVLTSAEHRTGSDRIWEVVQNADCDIVFNIQGDEPFLPKTAVLSVLELFDDVKTDVGSAMYFLESEKVTTNPNCVKVVCDVQNFALYFSRNAIPYNRDANAVDYFGHIGLYAYRKGVLQEFVNSGKTPLEIAENLEQLRFLQMGKKIKMALVDDKVVGIDTAEDLQMARELLSR